MPGTIRAVAEAAGVSKTTVSFVMNNTRPQVDRIPEETRERIKACAAALGYSHNPIAASLRTGKRIWIGVMTEVLPRDRTTWSWAPFFEVSLLHGVQTKLAEHGYFTLLGMRNAANEVQDMDLLASAKIGGLILRAADAQAVSKAEDLLTAGVPVVNVFPKQPSDLYPFTVDLDNVAGGQLAAELLAKCGVRRPAYATIAHDGHALVGREQGLVESIMQRMGISPAACVLPQKENSRLIDPAPAAKVLTDFISANRPDALVALDGGISIIVSSILDTLPISVPDDLVVLGFDGFLCRNSKYNNMSSIGVSWVQAGQVAAKIVIGEVENEENGHLPKLLSPVFVPGDSTPPDLTHEKAIKDLSSLVMP